jgi:hypothetical protein
MFIYKCRLVVASCWKPESIHLVCGRKWTEFDLCLQQAKEGVEFSERLGPSVCLIAFMQISHFPFHLAPATMYYCCCRSGRMAKVNCPLCRIKNLSRGVVAELPSNQPSSSVSNSVFKCQYRNRYNTSFSDLKTGIFRYWGFFTKYIPLPLKKSG